MHLLHRLRVFLPAWLLCAATLASAQSTYTLRGSVQDSTGAIVPGALLHLAGANGAALGDTHADSAGSFIFSRVPPGDLTLTVPASAGFGAIALPIHLRGNLAIIKVTLPLASVTQSIEVTDAPTLSTDSAANKDSVAVTAGDIRKLPVFDQDIVATMTSFLDASATGSGGVTLVVDGVEMKSSGVSASAIQEVRINNDPYTTEFTRPGRGRIEITTKPGTPVFHGEANFIVRDAIFNAKNFFALTRPPEARRIFEGHVTGPFGSDHHTNFIASGSYRTRDAAVVVDAITPAGPVNQNVLTPFLDTQAALRVTHDFSAHHRLQLGYNFEYSTRVNAGVGGLVLAEAGYNTDSREDDAIFNDRIILTPNLINQLLITFEKDEDVTRSVSNAQSIQVSGAFTGGGAQADLNRSENTVHINEVVSWNHGRHYLRFGAQAPQLSRRAVDDRTNRLGTFQFASLATYNSNTPYVYIAQQGPGRGLYWINEVGAFVQDQVKLSPHAQLSLGLRYDWQTYLTDDNNFSPRGSIAWAPGKGKTILRLGSGVFYDRTGGDFPAVFKLHNGIVLQSIQILNPTYPIAPGTGFTAQPSSIVQEDPNLRTPYTFNSSFGVERQVTKTSTFTLTYRNENQVKSFRSRDINAPILPANPSLSAVYPRPNPNYAQIRQIESGGRERGNALDVGFRGSVGRWFAGQAQYTLSRTWNTGNINSFPENQYAPNAEWSRASFDRLHSLNFLGTFHPDHLLSLGVALYLYSGTPYTETTGNDDFHTGLGNARPAGVGRNSLQSGGNADVDLLWSHDFHLNKAKGDKARFLSTGLSAFNVLNHPSFTGYIGDVNSLRFGQPTVAQPGRQLQFSAGFRF